MQSNLEIVAIDERLKEQLKSTYVPTTNEYDESDAKKGGDSVGSIADHTNSFFDTETGGDTVDVKGNPNIPYSGREGNMLINTYGLNKQYGIDVTIDTSKNVGQVVIY